MLSDVYFPRVNGVSTSIRTFREDLQKAGHRVLLVAPQYPIDDFADDPETLRVKSRAVPFDPEDRIVSRGAVAAMLPKVIQFQPEVVHVHTPFAAHYMGLSIAKQLAIPVVITYHTYFEHYLQHYLPWIPATWLRWASRAITVRQCGQVDAVISPSGPMTSALKRYGVQTPIRVIPTGLLKTTERQGHRSGFREAHGWGQRPIALFVGRVAHEKNIGFLLEMFPSVLRQVPEALLVIAGEGPALPWLQQEVVRRGLNSHVQLLGYLQRETSLVDCFQAADVFVFASRTETQGLVLIEALAQGTPVVSTAVMGTAEVLQGAGGAIVATEDIEDFSAKVVRVLTDPSLQQKLSKAGRQDAERWDSTQCMLSLLDLYLSVIAERALRKDPYPAAQLSRTH